MVPVQQATSQGSTSSLKKEKENSRDTLTDSGNTESQNKKTMAKKITEKNESQDKTLSTKGFKKGKWTPEEDKALLRGVKMAVEKGEKPNFRMIAAAYLDRSSKQAKERWENSLNPDIRKGRWTRKEELQLIDLMIELGQNWAAIQSKMPTRALHCVKAKGRLLLGERLSLLNMKSEETHNKEWSQNEIYELVTLHGLYGYDLKRISLLLGTGRSIAQLDRQLLSFCTCSKCRARSTDMQVASDVDSLKSSWTKVRAKAIKDNMLKESFPVLKYEPSAALQNFKTDPKSMKRKSSDSDATPKFVQMETNSLKRPRNITYVSSQQYLPYHQPVSMNGQVVMVAPRLSGSPQSDYSGGANVHKAADPSLYQHPQQMFMQAPPIPHPQVVYMSHPQANNANQHNLPTSQPHLQPQQQLQLSQQQQLLPSGSGFRQMVVNNPMASQFPYQPRPGTPPNYLAYC